MSFQDEIRKNYARSAYTPQSEAAKAKTELEREADVICEAVKKEVLYQAKQPHRSGTSFKVGIIAAPRQELLSTDMISKRVLQTHRPNAFNTAIEKGEIQLSGKAIQLRSMVEAKLRPHGFRVGPWGNHFGPIQGEYFGYSNSLYLYPINIPAKVTAIDFSKPIQYRCFQTFGMLTPGSDVEYKQGSLNFFHSNNNYVFGFVIYYHG